MRVEADGRTARCNGRHAFAVAVPAHHAATRLHITRQTNHADDVVAEVRRIAKQRLATTTVYVFATYRRRAGRRDRLLLTFDEDDLARIAIKEDA